MPGRIRVSVPSEQSSLGVLDAVVERFAANAGIAEDEAEDLGSLVRDAVAFTLRHAYAGDSTGEIELTLDLADRAVRVDVHDWGRPLAAAGGELGTLPAELAAIDARTSDLRLINLGADGKRISFTKPVPHVLAVSPGAHDFGAPPHGSVQPETGVLERIEIRDAGAAEAEAIASLLYENYHLSYGHPDFYRPQWIVDRLDRRLLLSSVALHDGEIIGHHAVMLEHGSRSAETGVAVVHPAFRGLGIFGRLFDHTLARANEHGLDAVWSRSVTVHPYSQRSSHSHGYREAGLLLGSVPARMTMEGVETAGPGRRTASLVGYRMLRPSPRAVRLPSAYEHHLRAVYANVGLTESQATRPAPPPPGHDQVSASEDATRNTGSILVTAWDSGTHSALVHAVRHLVGRHVDAVYADLDLHAIDDLDGPVERLNQLGFFYAGLALCGPGGHDFVRLQLPNSESIELEHVVCDSPFAQALLHEVLKDRERVDG